MADGSPSDPAPPLLAPLGDAEWPGEVAHLLPGFAGRLNVYRVMAHHPALLAAWERLRNHVVIDSELTPQQSEIVILRTGHRWQAPYEWAHHVVRGRATGLSEVRIAAARRDPAQWDAGSEDAALMAAVDALLDDGRLAPAQLADLQARIGTKAVLDVMATVGMYTTLAFLVQSFRTPIEPEIAAQLD